MGNLGGLHVEEEMVKYLKLPKTTELGNFKQLNKTETEFQTAIDK